MDNTYFLLNKREDYIWHTGYLCSECLDSGRKQTDWSRICIRAQGDGGCRIRVRVFVSGQKQISWKGSTWDIQSLIGDGEIPMEEKQQIFAPYLAYDMRDHTDCLLQGVSGRYLWLLAEGEFDPGEERALPQIWIFFEAHSWMSYLPEIYGRQTGRDGFLARYLSIFQWIYDDMGRDISDLPHMFYPAFADRQVLEWLASWFGMENSGVWNRSQLVWLLENGNRLNGIRGTRQYMEELVLLFTGSTPYIVEYDQTERYKTDIKRAKRLEKLYGEHASAITVVLPCGAVDSRQKAAVLRQIIRSAAPAYAECRMVALAPFIFLDRYTYVGMNTILGATKEAVLDGGSLMPYISMVGERVEGRPDQ